MAAASTAVEDSLREYWAGISLSSLPHNLFFFRLVLLLSVLNSDTVSCHPCFLPGDTHRRERLEVLKFLRNLLHLQSWFGSYDGLDGTLKLCVAASVVSLLDDDQVGKVRLQPVRVEFQRLV